ncbi:uncharacterized protein LOC115242104 isoform X2 [Formica exsecta]|uniref:uncharacterized protein LOC115242104 isoform X2 n=1 Tax=Formica exsecta TaxID=72781 RepID=UPI001144F466|nr:uncharacterized protein LOC115242104 isoform X2 [Formica exsecta]
MMNFTIMQILRQTFGGLYLFVASIASIKAGIAFILFISDIHNIESEDDIKYAAQSPRDIDIMEQNIRIIQIGIFLVCLMVFSCVIGIFNIWGPDDDQDDNDQQNHNQNNIHRNMNGNPFRFHED